MSSLNFADASEWILFGVNITSTGAYTPWNGTTVGDGEELDPSGIAAVVSKAHAAGSKVLLSVGGANTGDRFVGSTAPNYINGFVSSLAGLVKQSHCDGIDVDWEGTWNQPQFNDFIKDLRTALPRPYVISAAANYNSMSDFVPVISYLDEVNIMDYDLMGNWGGWVAWYGSSIYPYDSSGKTVTDAPGDRAVPSCDGGGNPPSDGGVYRYEAAGIPASKIGISGEFGGTVWTGVTAVGQPVTSSMGFSGDVPYTTIMSKYYNSQYYHWDTKAEASYLLIPSSSTFVSYDDSNSFKAKIAYVKSQGLGGLMIWDLGMAGSDAPQLLDAVKQDVASH